MFLTNNLLQRANVLLVLVGVNRSMLLLLANLLVEHHPENKLKITLIILIIIMIIIIIIIIMALNQHQQEALGTKHSKVGILITLNGCEKHTS